MKSSSDRCGPFTRLNASVSAVFTVAYTVGRMNGTVYSESLRFHE
jgi:hypothetical protein